MTPQLPGAVLGLPTLAEKPAMDDWPPAGWRAMKMDNFIGYVLMAGKNLTFLNFENITNITLVFFIKKE